MAIVVVVIFDVNIGGVSSIERYGRHLIVERPQVERTASLVVQYATKLSLVKLISIFQFIIKDVVI